jgi:ribosome biogenesis GTPase
MDLAELGWDAVWESDFTAHRQGGLEPARVVHEDKLSYNVVGASGDRPAIITGRLRHLCPRDQDLPKVGDWVAVRPVPGESKGVIEAILPRRSQIARKINGRGTGAQIVVSNIDVAFVVQAMDSTFNARRLERFLVMVLEGGVRPVLVLNKLDLCKAPRRMISEAEAVSGGALVLPVCAKTAKGTGRLREILGPGLTAVFIGTSGVGKSSLINRLVGGTLQPTLEVRDSDSKGRHATTWREIIPVPQGGLVIDTPGMREFHLWSADLGLDTAFPDITELAVGCRFRDCTHGAEPGCAVRSALEAGALAGGRYESFRKLQAELVEVDRGRVEQERRVRSSRPKPSSRHALPLDDGDGDGDGEGEGQE